MAVTHLHQQGSTLKAVNIQQHIADSAAGVSTVATGFYFMDVLEATALIVAILSGLGALAWHVYRAWREWQYRRDLRNGTIGKTPVEFTGKKD